MPRRDPNADMTPLEAFRKLKEGLNSQAKSPNVYGYKPHDKQVMFHTSDKKKRLYIGGNRSGKTTGAVVEDIYWLRGQHPYRSIPEGPIRGRVVGVDLTQGVGKILVPQFQQWMPPSLLKNGSWEDSYDKQSRTLTLTNGSYVEFMSYDQDMDKFAGTSRHFVHFDEEPPLHIFNECRARLIDTGGSYWISMTPLDGMTWVYDDIFAKKDMDDTVTVVQVDMTENPYLSKEAVDEYLHDLDADERKARQHGQFVSLGGRVYKDFEPVTHVLSEPFIPPGEKWAHYISLDHGYNNPTAILWHAVDAGGNIITYDESYLSETIIDEHARIMHEKNKQPGRTVPGTWIADPAIAQRQGVTGTSIATEYAIRQCYFAEGNNDVATGVAKIQKYLKVNPLTKKPFWRISPNCVNLIREMRHLRWATYASKGMNFDKNKQEKIHKKDDHACDSARYFFSFMPDLSPFQYGEKVSEENESAWGGTAHVATEPLLDRMLQKMVTTDTTSTKWKNSTGTDVGAMEYE